MATYLFGECELEYPFEIFGSRAIISYMATIKIICERNKNDANNSV